MPSAVAPGIHKLAVVETKDIGPDVSVAEFAIIRAGAKLGKGVVVHPHVVIAAGVEIGDGVEIFPGAFIGREPKGAGATARQPTFERRVKIGSNSSIGPHAVIYYDVEIGENTLIGDGASIREQCRIGNRCLVSRYVTFNYNTTMGDRSKVLDLSHITGNMTIGNDVFISTMVGSTNDNAAHKPEYKGEKTVGPTIKDFAMIGAGVTMLPGVVIGERTIVGSGSVVTKSIDADTLAMGVPARVIKSLVGSH